MVFNKGEYIAIPFVGAIIERENNGIIEILIQTRWKPSKDPLYSGTYEFVVGTLDKPYENIFDALSREIYEECGLKLKNINNYSKTKLYESNKNDEVFGFRPFCCTQQLKNGKPWIGFIFIYEVEEGEPKNLFSENRDVKWMAIDEIEDIICHSKEKWFSVELPAWEYYFKERKINKKSTL